MKIQIAKIEAALKPHRDSIITGKYRDDDGHMCSLGVIADAIDGLNDSGTRIDEGRVSIHYGLSDDDKVIITDASDVAGGGAASMDAVMAMLRERMES